MKKICLIIKFIALVPVLLYADEVITYTAVTKGFEVKAYEGTVFAGTDGGLVQYRAGEANVYDTDDGVFKADIKTVEKDHRGIFWLGHPDGSVTLYNIEKGTSSYIDDIEQAGSYTINTISSSDKYIYVAASGLLARYRYNSNFSRYEVSEINSMTGNVKDVTVSGGKIYICTNAGVFSIPEDSPNINYMNNWTVVSGLGSAVSRSLAKGDGSVFVLTNTGLFRINGEGNSAVKEAVFDGADLVSGYFGDGKFYVSHKQVEAMVVSSVESDLSSVPEIIFGTGDEEFGSFRVSDGVVYFTSAKGFSYYAISEDEEVRMAFNVPKEKGIKKIIFDEYSSRLMYLTNYRFSYADASDMTFYKDMFSSRGNGTNFLLKGNDLYICTWGAGVNLFTYQDPLFVYKKNYSFGRAREVTTVRYPVHPGISEDAQGRIWITNWDDLDNDSTVTVLNPSGEVENSFAIADFPFAYDIFADQYNGQTWIWLGSSKQSFGSVDGDGIGAGIFDGINLFIRDIQLPDGIIDIARDKNNIVWIGTNNGIRYIDLKNSPSNPQSFSTANLNTIQSGPIGNIIYDVEINSRNEKWFATDNGISVLSSDNEKWRHYVPAFYKDSPNVPGEIIKIALPDKTVNDIELDENGGNVIIASYSGLTVFHYEKNSSTGRSGEIRQKVYPFINDGASTLYFDTPKGLDTSNYIGKIFDMKNFLVRGEKNREIIIDNGWDGKDNNNRTVSSGIYKIIAYDKDDPSKNISGKIAVVRK